MPEALDPVAIDRLVVVWRVTSRCNLACGFCAFDRRLGDVLAGGPRRVADPERVQAAGWALAAHREVTGRPVLVSWLGGEPYLWKPLLEVSRTFRGLGLDVATTTNGTTLGSLLERPAGRAHLFEDLAELTVSLDAASDLHDRLRGREGLFAELERSIRRIADERSRSGSGLLLRVNAVLLRETFDEFPTLCRTLAEWGVDEVTFNPLGGRDRPEFNRRHHLLAAQVARLRGELPAWQREMAELGLRLRGGPEYLRRIAATAAGERLPIDDCAPGSRFLFVDEDCVAAPCSFTRAELGRPLAEALAPDGVERLRADRSRRLPAACDDCHCTQVFGKFHAPVGVEERLSALASV